MSLYCIVDDEDFGQVSTIQGWTDFIKWGNAQFYRSLAHLCQHGYSTKLETLAVAIQAALKENPPSPDVEATARGIMEIAASRPKAEILIVTDGDGDEDEDEEGIYDSFDGDEEVDGSDYDSDDPPPRKKK